jgi:hypothetical protein
MNESLQLAIGIFGVVVIGIAFTYFISVILRDVWGSK